MQSNRDISHDVFLRIFAELVPRVVRSMAAATRIQTGFRRHRCKRFSLEHRRHCNCKGRFPLCYMNPANYVSHPRYELNQIEAEALYTDSDYEFGF